MSPPRRRRDAYRPPRSRSEVLTAVAAVVGVIVVAAEHQHALVGAPGDAPRRDATAGAVCEHAVRS